MAKNKVEITGIKTSDLKVLKQEEMRELFRKYQNGDKFAKDDLVNGNLKLVLSILRKYNGKVENMDDLFQIGCVGLIKAIDNFNLDLDVKFSTYAVLMIEGEVKRYIRDNNTSVRVSRSVKELAYNILRYKEAYFNKNNYEPSNSEIANELGVGEFEISNALMSLKDPVSIFEPIYNDGGDTILLLDQIEDKKDNRYLDDIIVMKKGLESIDKRYRDLLVNRFIIGKTQLEVANEFHISQAQVSRLEKSAIKVMKRYIEH